MLKRFSFYEKILLRPYLLCSKSHIRKVSIKFSCFMFLHLCQARTLHYSGLPSRILHVLLTKYGNMACNSGIIIHVVSINDFTNNKLSTCK